jgi:hypothetical protein
LASRSTFYFRWRRQLNRPICVRPAPRRAMMPGDEIDRRGLDCVAPLTAQAAKQVFEGHVALASYQQPHGIADRAASAMQAMQLDNALWPVGEAVCSTKKGRMHSAIFGQEHKENKCEVTHTPARGVSPLSLLGTAAYICAVPTIDLPDDELAAVAVAIRGVIEGDRYPHAPRLDPLRATLARLDEAPKPTKTAPRAEADRRARR